MVVVAPGTTLHGCIAVAALACSACSAAAPSRSLWHGEAYLDLAYASDPEHAASRRWSSHGTSNTINAVTANAGYLLLRKDVDPTSRWGFELGFQDGPDTRSQVPAVQPDRDRPLTGAATWRRLARANFSYLADVGKGLLFNAGIINSFIGFESFYAKDNFNYTRSWIAENSPYFLLGVGVQYPFSPTWNGRLYLVNGYNYLSQPNDVPSLAGQSVWQFSPQLSITENFYYGSDQHDTELASWRVFSDTVVQWRTDALTVALALDAGTERMAERRNGSRAFWTGAAVFANWRLNERWSLALRPEFYWDADGRLTGASQLITAATLTTEYVFPYGATKTYLRCEYRYDHVEGNAAGPPVSASAVFPNSGSPHNQHLLLISLLWSFSI